MKTKSVMKKTLIAAAVAGAGFAAPTAAVAEVSATLDIASQYLWRGQQLFSGGTVSGSLDYEHDSGLYAGVWTSSESFGIEYDLYAGFAGSAGDFSYDIGVIDYRYSDGGTERAIISERASRSNFTEAYLGLGYMDFGFEAYIGVGDTGNNEGDKNEDNYFTLSYGYDKFGVLVGYYDFDDSAANYTHVDLSYEVYDGLVFTLSQIVDEDTSDTYSKETQLVVGYSFTF